MEPRWAASGSTSSGRAAIPTARPTESPSICAWNRAVDGENSPLQYDSSWLTSSAWLPPKDLGDSLSASSRTDRSIRQSSGSSRRTVAAIGPLCQSGPLRQPLTRDPSRCPAKERPRCARGRARDVDLGRTRATCAPRLGALRIRSPAQDDLRSSVEHARPWPGGHTDAPVTQESRTLRTRGPQTTAGQAEPPYGSHPRATNDPGPGGTSVRLAPAGHKRPQARRNFRTARAPGPRTYEIQHAWRQRANDDRVRVGEGRRSRRIHRFGPAEVSAPQGSMTRCRGDGQTSADWRIRVGSACCAGSSRHPAAR